METNITKWKDRSYVIGLVLIGISLIFFCLPLFMTARTDSPFAFFVPCFCMAVGYIIHLSMAGRLRKGENGIYPLFLFLVLALISCYALNREIDIFEESVDWMSGLLVLICINYASLQFFESFPRWLQHIVLFILGVAIVLFVYLSFYLLPVYFFGVIGIFFLGISLHVFIPLLFVIYSFRFARRLVRSNKRYAPPVLAGAVFSVLFVLIFSLQWTIVVKSINNTYREATAAENDGLPAWVYVAQHVNRNWITEKALKTELVYAAPEFMDQLTLWTPPAIRNFGETKKHDPLVVIGTFISGRMNIDTDTRIKILESRYDARHATQERLWSGQDLETEKVNTSIDIWPQYGMSYTEKLITVSNMAQKSRRWVDQQEAIYTFHLPEGAVITALSLWINGIEAKGILTTKAKAAEAYNTIVGREMRDPSVVHWQEGNTVSVRVFPVLAGESRLFKLGVTAPLKRSLSSGIYENIYFEGPKATNADEIVTIHFKDNATDFIIPASFEVKGKHSFIQRRKYVPHWDLKVTDQPLSTNAFSFDGRTYSIRPYQVQQAPANIQNIYLDINKAWTWDEFNSIYKSRNGKQFFVYNGTMVRLDEKNKEDLFYQLQDQQFSLFPFFLVDKSNSLVVTKNTGLSPNIEDLKYSRFLDNLKKSLAGSSGKIMLFNLGNELSPYLKTLKEYRIFRYEQGLLRDLNGAITANRFATDIETDNQVVIQHAGIAIQQNEGAVPSTAPDHLMRLFSYNHIMQKMGTKLLTDTTYNDELIDEAAKAYVVSPVSSLVVLETQKDYDRFDIKDNGNSLQNASHKSSGAVPEPHEWALIIIALVAITYSWFFYGKKRMA